MFQRTFQYSYSTFGYRTICRTNLQEAFLMAFLSMILLRARVSRTQKTCLMIFFFFSYNHLFLNEMKKKSIYISLLTSCLKYSLKNSVKKKKKNCWKIFNDDKNKNKIDLSGHMHLNFLNECYENEILLVFSTLFKINKL